MGGELIEADSRRQITAGEVRDQVRLIQEVMQSVMKKDTHYGVIPGCKQPSLYKAGSEVLLTTFRIGTRIRIEDASTADCARYRVIVEGFHQSTGMILGEGVGECSSSEEKYKWRKAVCDAEFDATPEGMRRLKYGNKGGGGYYTVKQVRTEPADQANTVLKMAKKRAQIDFTLTATAASDIFTQDIEDFDDHAETAAEESKKPEEPKFWPADKFAAALPTWERVIKSGKVTAAEVVAKAESSGKLTDDQRKTIEAIKGPENANS